MNLSSRKSLFAFPMVVLLTALCQVPVLAQQSVSQFVVSIKSDFDMEFEGRTQKLLAKAALSYTLKREKNTITLQFDNTDLVVSLNNEVMMSAVMNKELFNNRVEKTITKVEDASAALKKMLKDSYGTPIYQFEVDENQEETKGKSVARTGANEMIRNGQIENARLFHQPFYASKKTWKAPGKVSIGNGNYAKGELTFEKQKAKGDLIPVKVSGKLKATGKQNGLDIKDGNYEITGVQNFNTKTNEFESGQHDCKVSFKLYQGAQKVAESTGTMTITLKKTK